MGTTLGTREPRIRNIGFDNVRRRTGDCAGASHMRRAGRFRGYLAILEAAYRQESDEGHWIQGIVDAAESATNLGWGAMAAVWDERGGAFPMRNLRSRSVPPEVTERWFVSPFSHIEGDRARPVGMSEAARSTLFLPSPRTSTVDEAITRQPSDPFLMQWARAIPNCAAVRGTEPDGRSGIILTLPSPNPMRLVARQRACLDRVGSHMAAAFRLRSLLQDRAVATVAEVILSPRGGVEHVAVEDARPSDGNRGTEPRKNGPLTSDRLARTAQAVADRLRSARELGRQGRSEEAVAVWTGLLSGRWSPVEHADVDGKRHLLLVANPAGEPNPRSLAPRERQVLARAALGHPLKLIGYELGLSPPAVTEHLRSALQKLRLRDRAEAVRALGPRG